MQRNPHRGFTLLKLVLVLVALFLVAAILFPIFFRARESDHGATCPSNLKQIGLGLMQYVQDYNEIYPPAGTVSNGVDSGWVRRLQPYVKSLQLFVCPRDIFISDKKRQKVQSLRCTNYYLNRNLSQKNMGQVKTPATTILTGDGQIASSNYACADFDFCTGASEEGPVGPVSLSARTRHRNGSNYGFADGHVKWFKSTDKTAPVNAKNWNGS